MPTRQIDWRPELDAFAPYLADKSGVVRFRFASADCAANHFSTLLKQAFVDRTGNGTRFSVRIDHDFATTHTPLDILDEIATQLGRVGIDVADPPLPASPAILTGNDVAGDMSTSVGSINLTYASQIGRMALQQRIGAVHDAIDKFVAANGRFMIEFRDSPLASQNGFWRDIWGELLAKFVGKEMVFVHMLGPLSHQTAHEDAPAPDWAKTLPTGFATDDARQNDAYDDLIDVFQGEGQGEQVASASATTHLEQNLDSVRGLHSNLAAVLMKLSANKRVGE